MRRTIGTTAAIAALALGLSACSDADGNGADGDSDNGGEVSSDNGDDNGDGNGDEDLSIALISKGFQHQFWQSVKQGADEAAEELGITVTFDGPDDESEVEQQINQLQTALDSNPDALGIAALDSQAALPILEEAEARGIPIVAFDSGVESDIPVTTAATDNKAAAAEAAKQMSDLIGNEGDVAVICHDQTSVTGIDRRDGFVEYIEENEPNVEVVDIQYGGGDHLESTNITRAILESNPDLAGFYGCNEGSAIGLVNGIEETGRDDVVVVGFDSGKAQIDAIRDGVMAGAITQNPVGIGYETVMAAYKIINGESVDSEIDTGFYWYDADNIDDETIQDVIYE